MKTKRLKTPGKTVRAYIACAIAVAIFGAAGIIYLHQSHAATYAINKEAETATLSGMATSAPSTTASGGSAVNFGGTPAATCGNKTVPVGSKQVYLGDFSTGNFSQWPGVQIQGYNSSGSGFGGNSRASVVPGDCFGKNAVKFTVLPGDLVASGERSEVQGGGPSNVHEGDERWYEFSLKFPNDFANPTGGWFIVMQWHSGEGSPPLAIEVNHSGNVEIRNNRDNSQVYNIGPIVRGQYVSYVLHAKFSRTKSVGFMEAWVNGTQKLARTPFQNMSDSENYIKMGIYQGSPGQNPSHTVYNTGVRVTAP